MQTATGIDQEQVDVARTSDVDRSAEHSELRESGTSYDSGSVGRGKHLDVRGGANATQARAAIIVLANWAVFNTLQIRQAVKQKDNYSNVQNLWTLGV